MSLFQHAEEPIQKAIYETKVAPKGKKRNYFELKEGIEKMRRTPFAIHVDKSSSYQVSPFKNL